MRFRLFAQASSLPYSKVRELRFEVGEAKHRLECHLVVWVWQAERPLEEARDTFLFLSALPKKGLLPDEVFCTGQSRWSSCESAAEGWTDRDGAVSVPLRFYLAYKVLRRGGRVTSVKDQQPSGLMSRMCSGSLRINLPAPPGRVSG